MEHKTMDGFITGYDEEQGIVTALFAVFGNVDSGFDRLHNGAFTKTFSERGHKVLILDAHRTDSINATIAQPMSLREVPLEGLPEDLLSKYPDATGAAEITAQFAPEEDEDSKKAFFRLKNKWVTEWSFGYDALDYDFTDETKDGEPITVRNLRTVKLYEVSPVLWGMNAATVTTGAKADEEVAKEEEEKAEEEKPWDIFSEDEQFCVYKVDEDGNKIEEALHCYDNREEAVTYMRALYANVEEDADEPVEDEKEDEGKQDGPETCVCPECDYEVEKERGVPCRSIACPECEAMLVAGIEGEKDEGDKEMVGGSPVQRLGDVLEGYIHHAFTVLCDQLYVDGTLSRDERIELSNAIGEVLSVLGNNVPEELGERVIYHWADFVSSDDPVEDTKAGRILAQRNANRLVSALATILEILEDAGIDVPGYEREPVMEEPKTAPEGAATTDEQAGPETPTSKQLLVNIQKQLTEIDMEV